MTRTTTGLGSIFRHDESHHGDRLRGDRLHLLAARRRGGRLPAKRTAGAGMKSSAGPLWRDRARGNFKDEHFRLIHEAGFSHVRINLHRSAMASPTRRATCGRSFSARSIGRLTRRWPTSCCDPRLSRRPGDFAGSRANKVNSWRVGPRSPTIARRVARGVVQIQRARPKFTTNPEQLLARGPAVIRKSNPARTVILGPDPGTVLNNWSRCIPGEDRNLIVTFHYYDPFAFTHQGRLGPGKRTKPASLAGTERERQAIEQDFDQVQAWAGSRIAHLPR